MPASFNSCRITNVTSGECIGLDWQIQVAYSNALGAAGTIEVTCGGGVATPVSAPASGPNGTVTVGLTHSAAGGTHTISAILKHDGIRVAGDAVSVSIGNPCPIKIDGNLVPGGGLLIVDPNDIITGKYDPTKGNQVFVLVEERLVVNGVVIQPRLVFVGAADVQPAQGTWRHPVIQVAHSGEFIRAVLAKDGAIKSMVRAIFG
jgi:hypothetical protein